MTSSVTSEPNKSGAPCHWGVPLEEGGGVGGERTAKSTHVHNWDQIITCVGSHVWKWLHVHYSDLKNTDNT